MPSQYTGDFFMLNLIPKPNPQDLRFITRYVLELARQSATLNTSAKAVRS